MIARTVHKHTPDNEVNQIIFSSYIATKKKIKKFKIINIDEMNLCLFNFNIT